jgi:hypothetical protein
MSAFQVSLVRGVLEFYLLHRSHDRPACVAGRLRLPDSVAEDSMTVYSVRAAKCGRLIWWNKTEVSLTVEFTEIDGRLKPHLTGLSALHPAIELANDN